MRVALIKGIICFVTVLTIVGTTSITAVDFEVQQNNEQSNENTEFVTEQVSTEVTTTKETEETTEAITEVITEKPTQEETAVVKSVETTKPTETKVEPTSQETNKAQYSASEFMNMGVIHWNGWRWTWYSEKVLPGKGLDVPNRHSDSNGYICDNNDYICLSSSSLNMGTVIATPFGKNGKVYDTGCANDTIDVYVNW